MKTVFRLISGRKVAVEQTICAITAQYEGEEPEAISSQEYMRIVMMGTPVGPVG